MDPEFPRLFLHDTSWQVKRKANSDREFCHQMLAGSGNYHRLAAGEFYLTRGDERICVPCAARRGVLTFAPRTLNPSRPIPPPDGEALPLADPAGEPGPARPPEIDPARWQPSPRKRYDDSDLLGWDLDLLDEPAIATAADRPAAEGP